MLPKIEEVFDLFSNPDPQAQLRGKSATLANATDEGFVGPPELSTSYYAFFLKSESDQTVWVQAVANDATWLFADSKPIPESGEVHFKKGTPLLLVVRLDNRAANSFLRLTVPGKSLRQGTTK